MKKILNELTDENRVKATSFNCDKSFLRNMRVEEGEKSKDFEEKVSEIFPEEKQRKDSFSSQVSSEFLSPNAENPETENLLLHISPERLDYLKNTIASVKKTTILKEVALDELEHKAEVLEEDYINWKKRLKKLEESKHKYQNTLIDHAVVMEEANKNYVPF